MTKEIKELYKELSKQASQDGYYLIPKTFYEKLFNIIESLRDDIKRVRTSRDSWRSKYYGLKNDKP